MGCQELENKELVSGSIALVERGYVPDTIILHKMPNDILVRMVCRILPQLG